MTEDIQLSKNVLTFAKELEIWNNKPLECYCPKGKLYNNVGLVNSLKSVEILKELCVDDLVNEIPITEQNYVLLDEIRLELIYIALCAMKVYTHED